MTERALFRSLTTIADVASRVMPNQKARHVVAIIAECIALAADLVAAGHEPLPELRRLRAFDRRLIAIDAKWRGVMLRKLVELSELPVDSREDIYEELQDVAENL